LADALLCHVCGEAIAGEPTTCNVCDRPFHLRVREDEPGPDCGDVWINEQYLSLEFACDVCLGKRHARGREEPLVGQGH
jgi:hypothetical protein